MIKKVVISSLILTLTNVACAGTFYLAPTALYSRFASGDITYQGINARLGLGYGTWQTPWIYLAAEIFANPRTWTINNSTDNGQSLKTTYSYGASILPGVFLDDTLLGYLRLGVIQTHFDSFDVTKTGYQGGAGLQTHLTQQWDARLEYIYSVYNSTSGISSPKSYEAAVGFIYRFL